MFIKKRRSRELREHGIRTFVQTELNPKTRNELLTLIRLFNKDIDSTVSDSYSDSDSDLIIKYMLDSNADFFNMYRMKNNMEASVIDAEKRSAAAKAATKAAWIDAEARAYIRHQIHGILDGSIESNIVSPELAQLAADVKARAQEIVGSTGCEDIFDSSSPSKNEGRLRY